MIFVKRTAAVVHQRIAGPGLRDQHHHRVGQRIARPYQQLQGVVEARRVRLALGDQRPQLVEIVAQEFRLHEMPACRHPVDVSAQRVDLAVVADHPVGVGQPPRRKSVGGKALVNQGERGDHPLVVEVQIVLAYLMREQHPLVDERARREGRDVEVVASLAQCVDPVFRLLANDEQLALERILVGAVVAAANNDLANEGFGRNDAFTQPRIVDRHVAPADHVLSF